MGASGGYRAKVTARTVLASPLSFEIATDESFSDVALVGPVDPAGDLGAVHATFEGLDGATTYHWRPVSGDGDARVEGPPASFRTPPGSGEPLRFVFASCTSGRTDAYPSFATAASFDPDLYLHAGDWGYADLNSAAHRADHFHSRWVRLLRESNVARLLAETPLLFWQDDHDYQADNGWAETIPAYTVAAFDELHANPTDTYFDIRWGDAHIFCLDCRLFATDPAAPDDANKSRIGRGQKAWLKEAMGASDAPVLVVASSMVFRNKDPDDPGWHSVYATERDELLGFFAGLGKPVAILSGDSHGQRLIHHSEFGELYEITSSGTDFGGAGQGNNDPEHTLVHIDDRDGFAVIELDGAGPARRLRVRSVASTDGTTLFEHTWDVS